MPSNPLVSVVMGVYNNADQLHGSISSILQQSFSDFELIIINDGSTDHSGEVLENLGKKDSRICLLNQPNQGLTKSLIKACNFAKGKFIARHDVGDFSSPERFRKQVDYLQANQQCGLVFSYFKTVDALGHKICENRPSIAAVKASLEIENGAIATPAHHGSAMFRKSCYVISGGYREQFYFAQDLDLWLRMSEHAGFHVLEEVLYECLIAKEAISGKFHRLQKRYHEIIIESAQLRRQGQSEQHALNKAAKVKPGSGAMFVRVDKSSTLYFMASCLKDHNPGLAKQYLKQALLENPLNIKAWYKLLIRNNP